MLHFLKDWWKFIQIHQYYTIMALTLMASSVKQNQELQITFEASSVHDPVLGVEVVGAGGQDDHMLQVPPCQGGAGRGKEWGTKTC